MNKFKVNSLEDNSVFIVTKSHKKLVKVFKTLKFEKGKIVHVTGAPGTGKSTNIFHAVQETNLNVYNSELRLRSDDESSKEVFNKMFECLSNDLKIECREDIYKKLSEFDAILIADNFHDSGEFTFSEWVDKVGISAFYFYFLCIIEYFKNRKHFKNMNLIFQTSWKFYLRGKKYDIFTDFGLLSKLVLMILKMFFVVVEISYSQKEIMKIVKMHLKDADEEIIKQHIKKHGHKPRFICHAIEK